MYPASSSFQGAVAGPEHLSQIACECGHDFGGPFQVVRNTHSTAKDYAVAVCQALMNRRSPICASFLDLLVMQPVEAGSS